ncbi:hypothetical protein [Pseudomonas sp. Pseu.R1]|uniref:hypothetical protein n=1 Tax=Pseudomonas sp. Pseu.R1 TaxID=3379818 RepID=UPI003B936237
MNKKKWMALALAMSIAPIANVALAEPAAKAMPCLRYSGQMAPGIAAPGEYKIIHSYRVSCGTSLHNLTVRTQRGALQPITVQRNDGGGWVTVARDAHDPTVNWGGGNFRVILDNMNGKAPIAYRGSFSVPL